MKASSFFKNFDNFGVPVTSFTLGGQSTIKTWIGAAASIAISMLTLIFGLTKL